MKAKIINVKDDDGNLLTHDVTSYVLNGRKKHIVSKRIMSKAEMVVNVAINMIQSRCWDEVYNYLDDAYDGDIPVNVERTCDRLTT